jgi:large subunit ribosomal protein L25
MKKAIPLSVNNRAADQNVKTMRKAGQVPGVIYGNAMKNTSIVCNAKELHNVYVKAGENTLVDVDMGGKKIPCLIHAISFDPVTSAYEHIDLYAVDMTKKVTTHVPVVFQGECPAVKNHGGVLLTVHSSLEVTCLPSNIPESFVVDLTTLENLRDSVTVSKLKIPEGVTVKEIPETAIVIVQEPRKEEVIEPVVSATEGGEGAAAPGTEGATATAPGAAAPAAGAKPGTAPAAGAKPAAPAKK